MKTHSQIVVAHRRLIEAADTLNVVLGVDVIEVARHIPREDVYNVHLSEKLFFGVDYVEVTHNINADLVNLLRLRLMQTLVDTHDRVVRLGTYARIVRGTRPWVLVQGL